MLKKTFSFQYKGAPVNYDVSLSFFGVTGRGYTAVQFVGSVGDYSYSETANMRESPKDNNNLLEEFCDRFKANYKTSKDAESFFLGKGFSQVVQ